MPCMLKFMRLHDLQQAVTDQNGFTRSTHITSKFAETLPYKLIVAINHNVWSVSGNVSLVLTQFLKEHCTWWQHKTPHCYSKHGAMLWGWVCGLCNCYNCQGLNLASYSHSQCREDWHSSFLVCDGYSQIRHLDTGSNPQTSAQYRWALTISVSAALYYVMYGSRVQKRWNPRS